MLTVLDETQLRQRELLREHVILRTYHAMVDDWTEEERACCVMNMQLLHEVSVSYFQDVDRKKAFHGMELMDGHKRAGYTVKWLMRFRPVQMQKDPALQPALLVNEQLALLVAYKKLNVQIDKVPDSVNEHFLYMFRFRHLDANALAMSFCLLQTAYG